MTRTVQRKRGNIDVERLAALRDHLVAAGHKAGCGWKRHAAGVFEALAGSEDGLLSDNALASDFLVAAGSVGNDPMPGFELDGLVTRINDDDGVGPKKTPVFRRRALGQKVWLNGDFNSPCYSAIHAVHPNRIKI